MHMRNARVLSDAAPSVWEPAFDKHVYRLAERIAAHESEYQDILIARTESYGRALFVDGAIQSAECDEHIYHEALVHPALLLHPEPRHVLIVGGGEGASLREALRHRTVRRATMVDIDGDLVGLCRRHLPEWSAGAFDDTRARVVIDDGRHWLETSDEQFDAIVMDLTDQIELGPSFPLYTQQFYRAIDAHLARGGLLVVQAGEFSAGNYHSHCSIRRTLETVFAHVASYTHSVPSFFAQWSWVLASQAPLVARGDAASIDGRIASRVDGPLDFYDGAAHARLFTLTRELERLLASHGDVVTDIDAFASATAGPAAVHELLIAK
jgi:spermidine synthase